MFMEGWEYEIGSLGRRCWSIKGWANAAASIQRILPARVAETSQLPCGQEQGTNILFNPAH